MPTATGRNPSSRMRIHTEGTPDSEMRRCPCLSFRLVIGFAYYASWRQRGVCLRRDDPIFDPGLGTTNAARQDVFTGLIGSNLYGILFPAWYYTNTVEASLKIEVCSTFDEKRIEHLMK